MCQVAQIMCQPGEESEYILMCRQALPDLTGGLGCAAGAVTHFPPGRIISNANPGGATQIALSLTAPRPPQSGPAACSETATVDS